MNVKWTEDEKTNEVMAVMLDTLSQVERDGFAYCDQCGAKVYGSDLGEILEMLGSHGCEPISAGENK